MITPGAETIPHIRSLYQRDEVEMLAVGLHKIFNNIERILGADAASKKVTQQLDVPAALPAIMGNKKQLIEVVIRSRLKWVRFSLRDRGTRAGRDACELVRSWTRKSGSS
jgi:nitrogen-specific signal transduction histidine kinase